MATRMTASEALEHPWLKLNEDELTVRKLEDSIVQMKKFNARRRLKASANAVIAIGKMAKLMSLFKSSKREGSSAAQSKDGADSINLDGILLEDTKNPSLPPMPPMENNAAVIQRMYSVQEPEHTHIEATARQRSVSITPTSKDIKIIESNLDNDNDSDLILAIQKKISELEVENERIVWSLTHEFSLPISIHDECDNLVNTKIPALGSSETDEAKSKDVEKTETMKLTYHGNLMTMKSLRSNL
mmetsp:Transcript_18502/g.17811  ORF Transcript_18502/g.17811 Transcript_18502/m.17811 type:complete len:244 (-) Transcript_18502:233-964(-)